MTRRRIAHLVVLVAALLGLIGSVAWAATWDGNDRFGPMRFGSGMMGYSTGDPGEPVRDLAGARQQAQRFADRLDLRVGEVMRFENHYYAELTERDGRGATEVLVDPDTGAVMIEPGPAMMWNTRYGMMGGRGMMGAPRTNRTAGGFGASGMMGPGGMMGGRSWGPEASSRVTGPVDAAQARGLARQWLRTLDPDLTVGVAEGFPGYFTLHTMRGDRVEGMLSVNASTGAVWYHSWHGRFLEMSP